MKRRESTTDDVSPLHRDPRTLSSSSSSFSLLHPPFLSPPRTLHFALPFLTRDDDTRLSITFHAPYPTPSFRFFIFVISHEFLVFAANISLSLSLSLSLSFPLVRPTRLETNWYAKLAAYRCANTRSFSGWHASLNARRENVPESRVAAKGRGNSTV